MFALIARPRRTLFTAILICTCVIYYWPKHLGVSAWNLSPSDPQRINATIIALVRNRELDGMVQSIRELGQTWNHKFNYPWIFFNDEPFENEFKRRTQSETKSECKYELIPTEHWEVPQWIDEDRFEQSLKDLELKGVRYGGIASYHKMGRWNSGFFYKRQVLTNYKWYWRVEPNVHFFCDIDYDVFAYMQDNNKTYGFTISVYDSPQSVWTLWPETMKFAAEHPEYKRVLNLPFLEQFRDWRYGFLAKSDI